MQVEAAAFTERPEFDTCELVPRRPFHEALGATIARFRPGSEIEAPRSSPQCGGAATVSHFIVRCPLIPLRVRRAIWFSYPSPAVRGMTKVVNERDQDPEYYAERARHCARLARMCGDDKASQALRTLVRELALRALELGADPRLVPLD